MEDSPDRKGGRRLALLLGPPLVAAGLPWLLVAAFEDRLPDRAYVYGWSRVGPRYAHLAPTWSEWSAGWSYCLLFAVLLAVVFHRWRQWPRLQRALVAGSWLIGTMTVTEAVLAVIDVPGYPDQPMAWWYTALPVVVGLRGGLLGWAMAGSGPESTDTADPPPRTLPARRLRRAERVVFHEEVRSGKARVLGFALLLCAPAVLLLDPYRSGTAVVLLVPGLGLVLQARARVRVDGHGVLLTLPLLGRARRRVPYRHVRHAEVAERGPTAGWGLTENRRHWGYLTGRGPVLVVRLTDDRSFVAGVRDPRAAVEPINGELARQRTTGTTAGA